MSAPKAQRFRPGDRVRLRDWPDTERTVTTREDVQRRRAELGWHPLGVHPPGAVYLVADDDGLPGWTMADSLEHLHESAGVRRADAARERLWSEAGMPGSFTEPDR